MKKKACGVLTLLLFFMHFTYAQQKTITGSITGPDDLPLPGTSIMVKGSTSGTSSDFDGNYSILASPGQTIIFSFVGYKPQEKIVGTSNTINVTLEEDASALDEIVLMGYTKTSRTELTGSTVQLNNEDFEQVPVSTIDQVLQGKVAGLTFNVNSGTPGSTSDIRIRGRSSLTAGNDPLYVIDGVPVSSTAANSTTSGSTFSPLASINSNNVESITVLKDASATAAYGARGTNGVIVITTKNGKSGKTTFNFNSSYGFSNDAVDGPQVLTGAERETLYYEGVFNTYGESYGFDLAGAQAFSEANNLDGGVYTAWNAAGRPEANWEDVITNKDAPLMEYNISASGGDETYNFFTSLGYYDQEATVIGSDFQRFTGQVNLSKDFSDKITFTTRNSGSYSYQDGLLETSAYFSSPRAVKFFMPPTDQPYDDVGNINLDTSLPNPLWIAQEDIDDSKFTRITSNNSLNWELPIPNLTFNTTVAIDLQLYNYKRYRNRVDGDGASTNGYGWQSNSTRTNYVFQNNLDYLLNINEDHSLNFKALQEFQKNRYNYLEADAENFADDGLTNLNSAGTPTTANSYFTDWAVASYTGLMHYSGYQGKYVLDGTIRREGNSRFDASDRWGTFWSVGAAYNMQKEAFLANSSWLSTLKLRGSYGLTGNANISINQYQSLLGYDGDYNGTSAIYLDTFGADGLSWETSKSLDLGIDLGFFNNRITTNLTYYRRVTEDMLLNVNLPYTSGFSSQIANVGEMENKGFEFELNADVYRSEKVSISFGGNLATNENEVLKMYEDNSGEETVISGTTQRVESGHPAYGWYMVTSAGVDTETGDELYYIDGKGSETTNDYNAANQAWQGGSALPTITAGIYVNIEAYNFFLNVSSYYAGGHKVYEDWARYTNGTDLFTTLYYQGVDAILDRWQEPGDEARFGKMRYATTAWQQNSKFLYDGDFFRIKDITFGYNLPESVNSIAGLQSARIFVKATNPYTWVKSDYLKYDPEIDSDGFTGLETPPTKSIILGLNINF
ncbi:SusC/RagA family TonB-linked outer membrane protein [Formosa algae]|uniref:SusC/RagA family TonB-linked outer membrane protein n=1 Tax=Formosa algae TaxID=225843 RepID=UPI000CCDB6EC|nr:SusC/RagA family TonB-linked outer membrane protein [Formosa algae]PNW29301.1 SusC/RagA family TonB-linked outer membrane protein [Formosa algae]